jgi:hypothetical protein
LQKCIPGGLGELQAGQATADDPSEGATGGAAATGGRGTESAAGVGFFAITVCEPGGAGLPLWTGAAGLPGDATVAADPTGCGGVGGLPGDATVAADPTGCAGVGGLPGDATAAADPNGCAGIGGLPGDAAVGADPTGCAGVGAASEATDPADASGGVSGGVTVDGLAPGDVGALASPPVPAPPPPDRRPRAPGRGSGAGAAIVLCGPGLAGAGSGNRGASSAGPTSDRRHPQLWQNIVPARAGRPHLGHVEGTAEDMQGQPEIQKPDGS